jgi:hypothetical protein
MKIIHFNSRNPSLVIFTLKPIYFNLIKYQHLEFYRKPPELFNNYVLDLEILNLAPCSTFYNYKLVSDLI